VNSGSGNRPLAYIRNFARRRVQSDLQLAAEGRLFALINMSRRVADYVLLLFPGSIYDVLLRSYFITTTGRLL